MRRPSLPVAAAACCVVLGGCGGGGGAPDRPTTVAQDVRFAVTYASPTSAPWTR